MKALVFDETGGPQKLAIREIDQPQPAAGEVQRWTPSFGQVFVTAKVESGS